ncbi:MAG: ATP-binding cassette domain-containing protein [Chloroflexi bacterium]|nr:ATP-binding cassette domain-containing protein [Chloroflexota bacterium]
MLIEAVHLEKNFRVAAQARGLVGSIGSLVHREYRVVRAVRDVSFAIERGEMVGCLGPNGAGKSTTVKMLSGILVPSGGRIEVLGMVPHLRRKQVAQRIGVVFGQRTQLWWDLPLVDSLELLRYVYRVPADRFAHNMSRLRDLLDLDPFLRTPVRQLSLGQRMRGDLAAALLHDPEILYLDEPTIGLDVVAKHRVRDFLKEINRADGATVLLTTHDMSDVEQLCSRVLIIDRGVLLYDGTLDGIRDRLGLQRTLVVDLAEDAPGALQVSAARQVRADGPRRWLQFNRLETTAAELIAEVAARYQLHDLTIEEPDIESIVRRIYLEGLDPSQAETATTGAHLED